ncbi:hypothetical protein BH11VER1_BH11VER1_32520 [soil metagenome]
MIGQEYFDLRSNLAVTLRTLSALAPEVGFDPEETLILENLASTLKTPFVFVVSGEVNVGKSTFLNALFGEEFSDTGVVPTTEKILFFKYGQTEKRVPITQTLEEVFVPVEFLKDFHVVDTPGTNSVEVEHQAITERFVPMADMMIFVFSSMNPWAASAWQFLDRVHHHWKKNVIFLLQQCDLRTPEEIEAILDYMKKLCRERFNREFPIYPVSAKKAFLARSSGLDRDRLLLDSGFANLEQHISASLAANIARMGKVRNALNLAQGIVTKLQHQTGTRVSNREEKTKAFDSIENELKAIEGRTHTKLSTIIETTVGDFEKVADDLLARVHGMLIPSLALKSVFSEKRNILGIDTIFLEKLRKPNQERWDGAVAIIEDDIGNAADYLADAVSLRLKVQLREDLRPDHFFWNAQKKRLVDRVDEMLQRGAEKIELEKLLEPTLKKTRKMATGFSLVLAASLLIAIGTAVMGQWTLTAFIAGLGSTLGTVLWTTCSQELRRARKIATERMITARTSLWHTMTEQLRGELRTLYDTFNRILQPMREKLQEQEKRQTGQYDQVEAVAHQLRKLESQVDELSSQAG